MSNFKLQKFPYTRIATIDICEIGKQKHHVIGLIELDVTKSLEQIKHVNNEKIHSISFTAWLISVISRTLILYKQATSYRVGKNTLMIFDDINISMLVEKELNGRKVPIPLIIEKASEKSLESISEQIANAKKETLTDKDIVLQKKTSRLEKIYYSLPGFMRRTVWRYLLKHPKLAFKKMGNVAFTSVGMLGKVSGWFIPISIHPICFGISSIVKKPVVVDDKIEIRDMLNMSVLIDHDVIDGAPAARFISELSKTIKNGLNL